MHKEAKERNTGKVIRIEDARKGVEYICKYCGVDMETAQGPEVGWHFRCCKGRVHKRSLCAQMACCNKNNRTIYNAEGIITNEFFEVLFSPENDRAGGNVGNGGGGPYVSGGGNGSAVEFEIAPCRTLQQLWKAKVAEMPHDMMLTEGQLSDVFIAEKDLWRYVNPEQSLNNRVLQLYPLSPLANGILFSGSVKVGKNKWKNVRFIMDIRDKELCQHWKSKLFNQIWRKNGTQTYGRRYNAAMVAGKWKAISQNEAETLYGLSYKDTCVGVQVAELQRKNLIYAIPESKTNE